ncbi:HIG1 domain family member 2A, mitochondrial isoform X2 [Agrilus planipennis]|nr:HIG1 domain family member 2A, mitochondrial isoform X2 [Agrilus planipennis]
MSTNAVENFEELDFIKLQYDLEAIHKQETVLEKFNRKFKENPFVPIGCLATATALVVGLWSFKAGKRKLSQYMMRTRILAQGFTVFAIVLGIGISASKNANPVHK